MILWGFWTVFLIIRSYWHVTNCKIERWLCLWYVLWSTVALSSSFSLRCLEFASLKWCQFWCDVCQPIIFNIREGGGGDNCFLFCRGLTGQPGRCATEGGQVLVKGLNEIMSLLPSSVSSDVLEWKALGQQGNAWGGHDISVCLGRPVMLVRLVFQLSVSTSCNPKKMQRLPIIVWFSYIRSIMEIRIGLEDVTPPFCGHCASLRFGTWYDGSEVTWQSS